MALLKLWNAAGLQQQIAAGTGFVTVKILMVTNFLRCLNPSGISAAGRSSSRPKPLLLARRQARNRKLLTHHRTNNLGIFHFREQAWDNLEFFTFKVRSDDAMARWLEGTGATRWAKIWKKPVSKSSHSVTCGIEHVDLLLNFSIRSTVLASESLEISTFLNHAQLASLCVNQHIWSFLQWFI